NPSRRQVPRPDDITGLDRPTCRYHSNGVVGRPQKGEVRYEGENCRQSHSEVTHTPSTSPSMPGAVGLHRSSSGWWIHSDGHSASRSEERRVGKECRCQLWTEGLGERSLRCRWGSQGWSRG